ncbi:AAA family ATPase [Citromicrobium bathyomarinum]|uniref:AAA family ATPase n=1 Tax=Citromicrobium bathyomarinum TaxID=72174 RepID=UPI00315AA859
MRRAVVTGAPGSGKSTLLAEVARRGIATGEEVARAILQAPGGMDMRAEWPIDFALAMLEAQRVSWDRTGEGEAPILFDRGFADIVGFLRLEGLAVPRAIDEACRDFRYEGPVFHAPTWREIYRQDDERIQSWEEAVESDAAVLGAWREYGYSPITLPFADPAARAGFVIDRL